MAILQCEVLIGILLGPPILGLLIPELPAPSDALRVLVELGVLLMMLYIGIEVGPGALWRASKAGLLEAVGGFVVPFGLGFAAVLTFGSTLPAALFTGGAVGVTSLAR